MKKKFESTCPGCKGTNEVNFALLVKWSDSGSVPVSCHKCGTEYLVPVSSDESCDGIVFEPTPAATLKIGTRIVVTNKQHKLNNTHGRIIAKDHCNYRIELECGGKIWMPHHWIREDGGECTSV